MGSFLGSEIRLADTDRRKNREPDKTTELLKQLYQEAKESTLFRFF